MHGLALYITAQCVLQLLAVGNLIGLLFVLCNIRVMGKHPPVLSQMLHVGALANCVNAIIFNIGKYLLSCNRFAFSFSGLSQSVPSLATTTTVQSRSFVFLPLFLFLSSLSLLLFSGLPN